MRSVLLVLVVVLIGGGLFGLWRVLSSSGMELSDTRAAEVFASGSDTVALEPGELGDRAREDARTGASAADALTLVAPTATETAGVDEAALPPILTGRVVDANGTPIAGARVFAKSGRTWFATPLDIEPDSAARTYGGNSVLQVVETGADGRFVFTEELEPGHLRLAVRAAGCAPLYDEKGRLPAELPHDLGDLALGPGNVIVGRVVDLAGTPVAGAQLLQAIERGLGGMTVTVPGRGIPLGETQPDGRFLIDELPSGPWRILVDAPGFCVKEETGRAGQPGEREEGLEFVVEPGGTIRGKLTGAPPEMLARMRVEARIKQADSEGQTSDSESAETSLDVHPRVRIGMLGAGGEFAIDGLGAQTEYKLTAWERDDERGRWKRFRGVEPVSAWPGTHGVVLEYASAASLTFQVIDASTRAPVEEFEVWAGAVGRPVALRDEEGDSVQSHPEGRVLYPDLRPGGAGSAVTVRIRGAGYEPYEQKEVALANGEDKDLGVIALEPAPRVLIHVVDAATEAPVPDARVFMVKEGDTNYFTWYLREPDAKPTGNSRVLYDSTDDAGLVVLPVLHGEACTLVVSAPGFVESDHIPVLVVGTEDHEQTVRLLRGGTAIVAVVDTTGRPVSGVSVEHREVQPPTEQQHDMFFMNDEETAVTDSSGILRISTLKPADYEFRIQEEGTGMVLFRGKIEDTKGWERVTLHEGSTERITLTTEPRGSLKGVVMEGGGALAGASVRLQRKAETETRQYFVMGGNAGNRYSALTGHDGEFEFLDVKSGEYTIHVDHADREMTHSVEVTVLSDGTQLPIDLPVAIIEGRVRDSEGRALRGIEVSVRAKNRNTINVIMPSGATMSESDTGQVRTNFESRRQRRARTDASGRYSLRGVTTGVPLTVSVESKFHVGGSRPDLELDPDEILRGIDFELAPAGRIEVVLSKDPEGLDGYVRIRAVQVAAEGESSTSHSTGIYNGTTQTLSAVLPGRWRVTAFRKNGDETIEFGTEEVEVSAGRTAQVKFITQ